jgi:DNA-binding GntR family transcriptional regulator
MPQSSSLSDELACIPEFSTKQRLAVDRLRRAILAGRLVPGSWLRQEQLCALTGLSRTPIREALVQLESEGLITLHAHRGALVKPLSADEFEEIYLVRGQLEPLIANLSATTMSPADLSALHACVARLAASVDDYARFLSVEDDMRRIQYRSCARPNLYGLVIGFRERAARYLALYSSFDRHTRTKLRMDHELLAACAAHDGAAAERLTADALRATSETLLPLLRQGTQ